MLAWQDSGHDTHSLKLSKRQKDQVEKAFEGTVFGPGRTGCDCLRTEGCAACHNDIILLDVDHNG
jgi:hypothetical protein